MMLRLHSGALSRCCWLRVCPQAPARKRCAAISISRRSAANRVSRRTRSTRSCRIRQAISGSARRPVAALRRLRIPHVRGRPTTMRPHRAKRPCPRSPRMPTARSGSAPAARGVERLDASTRTIDRVPTPRARRPTSRTCARSRSIPVTASGSAPMPVSRADAKGVAPRTVAGVAARRRPRCAHSPAASQRGRHALDRELARSVQSSARRRCARACRRRCARRCRDAHRSIMRTGFMPAPTTASI